MDWIGGTATMPYVITDACNNCGTCVETCPSEAIKPGDPHHIIDSEECIDCGACAGECPNDAIKEV
jgi:NAD-dependent dihydropyrimidine dehydrogenase PreA subunit